jgi:uncharacterized tellurite resistance protein B-like protein
MFFRQNTPTPRTESELQGSVESALLRADAETIQIVVSIAGLFGCISYADRDFSDRERQLVRNLLQTIKGISAFDADAILHTLQRNIVHISTTEAPRFCRTLLQLADRELRLSVLDMLLDIAAVDHDISNEELIVLRQVTTSFGLEQADYNRLQAKHRTKLRSLRPNPNAADDDDASTTALDSALPPKH